MRDRRDSHVLIDFLGPLGAGEPQVKTLTETGLIGQRFFLNLRPQSNYGI